MSPGCKIVLEGNDTGVYYAGEKIKGRVECDFSSDTKISGITILLLNEERTFWIEYGNTYTGEYKKLYWEKTLFKPASGSYVMHKGHHVYHFADSVPSNIASTFASSRGSISYKLEATVEIPYGFNHVDHVTVIVESPVIASQLSKEFQKKKTLSNEKTVGCCCCKRGKITMDVQINKTYFILGESIDLTVAVNNMSTVDVSELKVELTSRIFYWYTSSYKNLRPSRVNMLSYVMNTDNPIKTIAEMSEKGIPSRSQRRFNLSLELPSSYRIPNFTGSYLMRTENELNVCCKLTGCNTYLEVILKDIQLCDSAT